MKNNYILSLLIGIAAVFCLKKPKLGFCRYELQDKFL